MAKSRAEKKFIFLGQIKNLDFLPERYYNKEKINIGDDIMKKFKAESVRLLGLMVNSIYTNKEIFLRELISNASDAIDKRHFASLTDSSLAADFEIVITADKDKRFLTVQDNGIGMDADELDSNLGTIASSGTFKFKAENKTEEQLIGQFGVGFYSAFMVADQVEVITKKAGQDKAFKWSCNGPEGYEITDATKDDAGTTVILHLKEDDDDCKYSEFLEDWYIESLVKKYSDYIRYPIKTELESSVKNDKGEYETKKELRTVNSMVPLWKKPKEVEQSAFDEFYRSKFYDFTPPKKTLTFKLEGTVNFCAMLFVPARLPYNYYTADYKRGIQLYSGGVMIMESCQELLPEYLGFIKGVVDTDDVSLNISREMLQKDRQLKAIASALEKKIISELKKWQTEDRKGFDEFFNIFGSGIKFGAYNNFGEKKEILKDLLEFYCGGNLVTLKEYVEQAADQDKIYYACGQDLTTLQALPKVKMLTEKGKKVLLLTDRIDEFVIKTLESYDGKKFISVSDSGLADDGDEEIKKASEDYKEIFDYMKECLEGQVEKVVAADLGDGSSALTAEGEVSLEMEKVLSSINKENAPKAKRVLQVNPKSAVFGVMKKLYDTDKDSLKPVVQAVFYQAAVMEGLPIDKPEKFAEVIDKIICGIK